VLLAGCSTFENGIAATVDGKSIPIRTVEALSNAVTIANTGKRPSSDALLQADDARSALGILIQFAVAERTLASLGEVTTSDEELAAEQKLAQLTSLKGPSRGIVVQGLAAEAALDRVVTQHWDSSLGQKVLDEVYASQPSWDQVCATGVIGPAEKRAEVQALIDGGAVVTDATAFQTVGFQVLSKTGQFCTSTSGVPAEVAAAFADTTTTGVQVIEFENPGGQRGVTFFLPGGSSTIRRGDDALRQVAAQSIQQGAQSGRSPVMAIAIRRSKIAIDPRFGSFDPVKGIVPPPAPPTTTSTIDPRLVQPGAPQGGAPRQNAPASPNG